MLGHRSLVHRSRGPESLDCSELDVTVGIGLGDKSGALGLGDSVDFKRAAETGVGLDVSFGGGWTEEFGV
jgi:hypothetical protein